MLNLEPLITRLVDDVLRAIRGATLAELRSVLALPEDKIGEAPRAVGASRVSRARAKAGPAGTVAVARTAIPETRSPPEPEPHSTAEITDPERLLAAATATPDLADAPAPAVQVAQAPEAEEAPASGPVAILPRAPASATARLRVGESLASGHGSSVVIRRAKKT
jgi:hypothetical protein